jgi:Tol biopolymer transport system component
MNRCEKTGKLLLENKAVKLKRVNCWLAVSILSAALTSFAFLLILLGCTPDLSNGQQFDPGLYVIDVDGNNPTSLGAIGWTPRWSPDGNQIVYVSNIYDVASNSTDTEIRVVNADGSGQRTLFRAVWPTSGPLGFGGFWSRDAKHIAFYVWDKDKQKIAVINTDGSELKTMEELDESFPGMFGYSPDGQKKIMTTDTNEIYVVQLDSGEKTLVGIGYDATWSNDSKQIIFSNNKDGEICVTNADGGCLTKLGRKGHACAVSPDGSRIVFVVTEWTLNPRKHGPDNLYLMNSDGSNYVRLTSSSTDEDLPAWSPDGKKIVFEVRQESRGIFSSGSD